MANRDEFSDRTKFKLAARAGFRCSRPDCHVFTHGPALGNDEGVVNLGVAAHITAAAANGPRYDPSLSSAQRKRQGNGIWLCLLHARQIDVDEQAYPTPKLKQWKTQAEERAALFQESSAPAPFDFLRAFVTDPLALELFGMSATVTVESIKARLHTMALQDLEGFRRMEGWPDHPIELLLTLRNSQGSQSFTPTQLAAKFETFDEFTLVSDPGTGKSTSLIQLTESILAQNSTVAIFIRLAEWASQTSVRLLESILQHHAFSTARVSELNLLASAGALIIVLDGWNELDEPSRQRARVELQSLKRDFPDLGVIVSTRKQTAEPPLGGPVVQIEPMNRRQRHEIARAIGSTLGEQKLSLAESTEGIRDLVRIPLFLTALLSYDQDDELPDTKEALLSLFVIEQERRSRQRSDALFRSTQGFHRQLLQALATEATNQPTTVLADNVARRTVSRVLVELQADGQVGALPQPAYVLDTLVAEHLLIRSSSTDNVFLFQHHQLQEWFASFEVESSMKAAAAGDSDALGILRNKLLNWRPWEQATFFAFQRMSQEDSNIDALVLTVTTAMTIDPLLAADMIYFGPAVWARIGHDIFRWVTDRHQPGTVDDAVAFMNTTGREEFAHVLAPLFGASKSNIYLNALRAGHRLPPSLFGPAAETSLLGLSEPQQRAASLELIQRGGGLGPQVAKGVAARTTSQRVALSVAENLYHQGFDIELVDLLRANKSTLLSEFAKSIDPDDSVPDEIAVAIRAERKRYLEHLSEPEPRLQLLLDEADRSETFERRLSVLLSDSKLDLDSAQVQRAEMERPDLVVKEMLTRAKGRQPVPFRAASLARQVALVDDSTELRAVLVRGDVSHTLVELAAATAGPANAAAMLDRCIQSHYDAAKSTDLDRVAHLDTSARLFRLLRSSPLQSVARALVSSRTEDPSCIARLAVTLHSTSRADDGRDRQLSSEILPLVVQLLERWTSVLLRESTDRSHCASLAGAIGGLGEAVLAPQLLKLLDYDLTQWRHAQMCAASSSDPSWKQSSRLSFTNQYRRALIELGDERIAHAMLARLPELDFGEDSALVLRAIRWKEMGWRERYPASRFWPSLGTHLAQHVELRFDPAMATDTYATAILDVARELAKEDRSVPEQEHATRLAAVAIRLPCGDPMPLVTELLSLSTSAKVRFDLLASLAAAGGVVSANVVLSQVAEMIEQARLLGRAVDYKSGPVKHWLSLLPRSDRPSALLDGIELLPTQLQAPQLQTDLLGTIAATKKNENEAVLFMMANKNCHYLELNYWWHALREIMSISTGPRILQLVTSDAFDSIVLKQEACRNFLRDILAISMKADDAFRQKVRLTLDAHSHSDVIGTVLADAIAQAPDHQGMLALVRHQARINRGDIGWLGPALRAIAIGAEPDENWKGAFNLFGVPVPDLRRDLFALVGSLDVALASTASKALVFLEELRELYGHVDAEPRHPDPMSALPWPIWTKQS